MSGSGHLTAEQKAHWNDDKQPAIYGSMAVFLVLVNGIFLARVGCQLNRHRRLLLEDYVLALATALCNIGIVLNILTADNGLGLHDYRIIATYSNPGDRLTTIYEYIYISASLQAGCLAVVKLGLLFMYKRIFLVNQKWLKILWWGNLGYVIAWFFASIFFYIFQCTPVDWYWHRFYLIVDPHMPHDPHAFCSPVTKRAITATLSLNLASDLFLLTLPGVTIATLKTSTRKKIGLAVVFGFGLLYVLWLLFCFSCMMLTISHSASGVSLARIISLREGSDPTYNTVNFLIFSSAEQATAVVCACWPVIVPSLLRIVRARRSSSSNDIGHIEKQAPSPHSPPQRQQQQQPPLCQLPIGNPVAQAQARRSRFNLNPLSWVSYDSQARQNRQDRRSGDPCKKQIQKQGYAIMDTSSGSSDASAGRPAKGAEDDVKAHSTRIVVKHDVDVSVQSRSGRKESDDESDENEKRGEDRSSG